MRVALPVALTPCTPAAVPEEVSADPAFWIIFVPEPSVDWVTMETVAPVAVTVCVPELITVPEKLAP